MLGIYDVERWRKKANARQMKWWFAYYRLEPWGSPWQIAGRQTAMIRQALGCGFDEGFELRFMPTYRDGDEVIRKEVPQTDAEIRDKLASLPGMKRRKEV